MQESEIFDLLRREIIGKVEYEERERKEDHLATSKGN